MIYASRPIGRVSFQFSTRAFALGFTFEHERILFLLFGPFTIAVDFS